MGCSSLLWLTNLHSSTELSRGWISRTLGNAPPSNAYTNAFGSSVLAKLLRNPPDIRICRLTSGVVLRGRQRTSRHRAEGVVTPPPSEAVALASTWVGKTKNPST